MDSFDYENSTLNWEVLYRLLLCTKSINLLWEWFKCPFFDNRTLNFPENVVIDFPNELKKPNHRGFYYVQLKNRISKCDNLFDVSNVYNSS